MAESVTTPEETDRWFEDDNTQRALAVNEGELTLLPQPSAEHMPHSRNTFTITADSIEQGWVGLRQCYDGLDPVAEAELVYSYRQMRSLSVVDARRIGRAWVESDSVQLRDVRRDAELCITAEVRVFYQSDDGTFRLVSGPYHRKFLDGYYPLHVTLTASYPSELLRFVGVAPAPQPGLALSEQAESITLEAWFEGKLSIDIGFKEK